jgi:hypothetical protein
MRAFYGVNPIDVTHVYIKFSETGRRRIPFLTAALPLSKDTNDRITNTLDGLFLSKKDLEAFASRGAAKRYFHQFWNRSGNRPSRMTYLNTILGADSSYLFWSSRDLDASFFCHDYPPYWLC